MSNFLFENDGGYSRISNFRVVWIKVESGKPVPFTMRSFEPIHAGIHWHRRAFLCPGHATCPVCEKLAIRPMSYFFGGSERSLYCLEVSHAAFLAAQNQMCDSGHELRAGMMGCKFVASRASKKKGIRLDYQGGSEITHHLDQIDEERCLVALGRLFGLHVPLTSSGIEQTKSTLATLARSALSPTARDLENVV